MMPMHMSSVPPQGYAYPQPPPHSAMMQGYPLDEWVEWDEEDQMGDWQTGAFGHPVEVSCDSSTWGDECGVDKSCNGLG